MLDTRDSRCLWLASAYGAHEKQGATRRFASSQISAIQIPDIFQRGQKALSTILISLLAGIVSSLLTIYLTPRARHGFWSRERIAELRLATYDKVNGITAAIYMHEPAKISVVGVMETFGESSLSPMKELLASLMTAHDEVRNRFSEKALHAYEKLQRLVEHTGLLAANRVSYSAAREEVLKQLHTESLAL